MWLPLSKNTEGAGGMEKWKHLRFLCPSEGESEGGVEDGKVSQFFIKSPFKQTIVLERLRDLYYNNGVWRGGADKYLEELHFPHQNQHQISTSTVQLSVAPLNKTFSQLC